MAFLTESFDIATLPESTSGFDPLPAGWYQATIASTDLKTTKAGNGQYIKLRYDIVGPTHQGRVVFGNLNVFNPNPKAEEIGREQLRALMLAAGLSKLQDTDELVGATVQIKLAIRNDPQYGSSNEVQGFKALNGGSMPRPSTAPAAAPAAAQAPAGRGAPPWAKK
jgi:hypothetical protein